MSDKGAQRKGEGETLVKRYDPARTHSWLAWLAQQMRAHHQTVFSGEDIQPSWVPPPLLARAIWLVEVVPIMLLGAAASIFLSFLLVAGVVFRGDFIQTGLAGGFLGWCLCSEVRGLRSMRSRKQHMFQIQARRLLGAGCLAFLYPASTGLDLEGSFYTVSDWIRDWIIFGCAFLVSGWLLQVVFSRRLSIPAITRSQPSSHWNRFSRWWHTASARHMCWTIVILGLSYGLSFGLSYTLHYGLRDGLSYGLSVGLSYAPTTAALVSLNKNTV